MGVRYDISPEYYIVSCSRLASAVSGGQYYGGEKATRKIENIPRYGIALAMFLHLVLLTGLCDEGNMTLRAWTLLAVADVIAICVLIYEETLKAHSCIKELLTEKEYICAKFCASGLPTRKISQYRDISYDAYASAIRRARKKCFAHYGEIFDTTETVEMPKREHRPVTKDEHAEILRLFNEGMGVVQIEHTLGRHKNVIYRHIKKFRRAATQTEQ